MNWRTWVPLVVALAIGLVAAKLARDLLARSRAAAAAAAAAAASDAAANPRMPVRRLVVAARDVPAGSELSADDLALAELAAHDLPEGTWAEPASLVGRVTEARLVRGQTVLESLLAPAGTSAGPSALVPAGMRAVAVEVNEFTGVAGHVTRGSRVDVVASIPISDRPGDVVSRTVAQGVLVWAVGPRSAAANAAAGASGKPAAPPPPPESPVRSVTLLVTPKQAETLQLLSAASARCTLALRGPRESAQGDPGDGTTLAELGGPAALARARAIAAAVAAVKPEPPPVVAKAPPATRPAEEPAKPAKRTVELIVGGELTRVEVERERPASPPSSPAGAGAGALTGAEQGTLEP